jgi:DNA-binding transcriptional LysR family regulator
MPRSLFASPLRALQAFGTVARALAAGQLTMPFPLRVALDNAYWLVWRPGRETARPVAAFRRWLAAEVALAPRRSRTKP